jgi:VIT1/CCC1 family predicted Fe2+/Mn2+ transporter
MQPAIWLLAMFFLGIGAMALCFLFMRACEKI